MVFKKSKKFRQDSKLLFPSWGDMFPGSNSKYKCNTLSEAFICLLSLILDH